MSRVLVTGGPGFVGSRVILRLLAAGRVAYATVSRPRRAAEMQASLDTGDVQPIERASFIVADRDNAAGRLDAAAGCEFFDDRIRLRE